MRRRRRSPRCCCTPRRAPSRTSGILTLDFHRRFRWISRASTASASSSSSAPTRLASATRSGCCCCPRRSWTAAVGLWRHNSSTNSRPTLRRSTTSRASPAWRRDDPSLRGLGRQLQRQPEDAPLRVRAPGRRHRSGAAVSTAVSTATAAVATVAAVSTVASFGAAVGPTIALAAAGCPRRSSGFPSARSSPRCSASLF